jgi:hypothetical protein
MKKLLFLPLVLISCLCFAQPAEPNRIGLTADFDGFFTFGGIMHGNEFLRMYCLDGKKNVTFTSGIGIKNPPKSKNDKISDSLIYDLIMLGKGIDKRYVFRVKAKSVFFRDHGAEENDIVWTPTKITLLSNSSSLHQKK